MIQTERQQNKKGALNGRGFCIGRSGESNRWSSIDKLINDLEVVNRGNNTHRTSLDCRKLFRGKIVARSHLLDDVHHRLRQRI